LAAEITGDVLFDAYSRGRYATDASFYIPPSPSLPDGSFSTEYLLNAMRPVAKAIKSSGKRGHIFVCSSTTTPGAVDSVRAAVAANHRVLYLLATDPAAIQYVGGTRPAPFSIVNTTRWPSTLNAPPRHVDHELVAVYLATVGEDGLARPVTPP